MIRRWGSMLAMVALLGATGCDDEPAPVAVNLPPHRVDGVYSVTGDLEVTIYWRANQEDDISYYTVYRNNQPTGNFTLIGTTAGTQYVDQDVANGVTYYYAVAAVDFGGLESAELSYENVFDTPRPEGFDAVLTNANVDDFQSGWDFSAFANRPSADVRTDIYYAAADGHFLVYVPVDTRIQDTGYVALRDVDFAPPAGWSTDGIVEAIVGHSYIVLTRDDHYAKFEVTSRGSNGMTMDWAYQVDIGNPELAKPAPAKQTAPQANSVP